MFFHLLLLLNIWILVVLTKGLTLTTFWTKFFKPKANSVLYLENFPFENAGFQYRAFKWGEKFRNNFYLAEVKSSEPQKTNFDTFLVTSNRSLYLIKYMWKKFFHCLQSLKFETVVIRRELLIYNDYGGLFMEKFINSIHQKVILDFDDDISFAKSEHREIKSLFGILAMEDGNKFNNTLKSYNRFIVGSQYLKQLVQKRNPALNDSDILVLPTCVDYDKYQPKKYENNDNTLNLGWVGGNHNLFLLDNLVEPLNQLSKICNFQLVVISGRPYVNVNAQFKIINKKWSLKNEVSDIKLLDIGLMPLLSTKRDKGKAGFKLLQYMGLGIVSVASGITVNKEIVDDGVDSFLVDGDDWFAVLNKVIHQEHLFQRIGSRARKTVVTRYTFSSNFPKLKRFIHNNQENTFVKA